MQLASRFASRSPSLRSDYPLTDDQIHRVAPSIFADAPHESRSQRYAYIPTAADAGDTKSQYNLGLLYEKGDGISQDLSLAIKYIKLSADSKFPPALTKLGYFYKNGKGVQTSVDEAVKYTKMAADLGDGTALYNLAQANINGDIKPPNKDEFERLIKLSAEKGLSDGQAGWGSICLNKKEYTESEICKSLNIFRIYECGSYKFELKIKN